MQFYLAYIISVRSTHFMRKGKDLEPDLDPELDPDPYQHIYEKREGFGAGSGSGSGSGSPTLSLTTPLPPLLVTEPEGHHCKVLALEANIRDGEKTVHVVFKNLSRLYCRDGVGREPLSPPHYQPIFQLIREYFIQRRRNCYSPSGCFLHVWALSSKRMIDIFYLKNLFWIVFAESLLRTTNLKSKSSYQLNQFPLATNKYGSRQGI